MSPLHHLGQTQTSTPEVAQSLIWRSDGIAVHIVKQGFWRRHRTLFSEANRLTHSCGNLTLNGCEIGIAETLLQKALPVQDNRITLCSVFFNFLGRPIWLAGD